MPCCYFWHKPGLGECAETNLRHNAVDPLGKTYPHNSFWSSDQYQTLFVTLLNLTRGECMKPVEGGHVMFVSSSGRRRVNCFWFVHNACHSFISLTWFWVNRFQGLFYFTHQFGLCVCQCFSERWGDVWRCFNCPHVVAVGLWSNLRSKTSLVQFSATWRTNGDA